MPGIDKINKEREERFGNRPQSSGGSELILRSDGDQAIIAVVASGNEDNDNRISAFYRHVDKNDEGQWEYGFCKRSIDERCDMCDNDKVPQHRFGFWVYVYSLLRKEAGQGDGWKKTAYGKETFYELEINNFKMLSLPFGRNEMIWNQFMGIFHENGAMNKVALRVKRDGSGRDTVWNITPTNKQVDWDEISDDGEKLGTVKDYYIEADERRKQQSEAISLTSTSNDADAPESDDPNFEELF